MGIRQRTHLVSGAVRAFLAPSAIVALLAFPAGALAVTTNIAPGKMHGWHFLTNLTATAQFVTGPGAPPFGTGSAELAVGLDGDAGAQIRNRSYEGVRLDALTALEYRSYISTPSISNTGQAPYVILNLDHDGDLVLDDLLFFEPEYSNGVYNGSIPAQPAVAVGVWQTWNALGGGWWSAFFPGVAGPGADVETIATYLVTFPNATIMNSSGNGGVRLVTGFGAGAWDQFTGSVDGARVATAASDTTYDFELATSTVGPGPPGSCISIANPCVTVPVNIARDEFTHIRGFSVKIQLSANLELCGSIGSSVTEGTYLNSIGGTVFQVVSNGGGLYTVDCAILGVPCGATASTGNLFSLSLKKAPGPDGVGTVTVTTVTARDCDNGPVAAVPGPAVNIDIDTTPPAEIADLTGVQLRTGNDADGTTKIQLTWSAVEVGATVEVYRAGFGFYPEYDDGGGVVPAVPSYPPGAPWALTPVAASGAFDEVAAPRDFWYYVAFVTDACGNRSGVSNPTNGNLNYHLGDVSDGFVAGQGNNLVGTEDISLLGAFYGIFGAPVIPVNYLDVGPTTNFSVHARPTTDDRIDFEDLILFAINHGVVSAPGVIAEGGASGSDLLRLEIEGSVAVDHELTARLTLTGSGRIQGLSIPLAWNAAVVEPIGMEAAAELLARGAVALAPAPGTVDAALLGVRESGFAGEIEVATVRFRVKAAGDPRIGIGEAVARDAGNRPVALGTTAASGGTRPVATSLLPASPNPARGATLLAYGLARPSAVDVAIYSVDGRRRRSLFQGAREAGFHQQVWDGTDDGGRRVAAGVYYAALATGDGVRQSRTVILLDR